MLVAGAVECCFLLEVLDVLLESVGSGREVEGEGEEGEWSWGDVNEAEEEGIIDLRRMRGLVLRLLDMFAALFVAG